MPAENDVLQQIPLKGMRGAIARRMLQAQNTKPHVTLFREVETGTLAAQRAALAPAVAAAGGRLTWTVLWAALVTRALVNYPRLNGWVLAEEIQVRRSVNLGVAVALPEGLLVPVVREAERLDLAELAARIADLAERARSGRLKPPELMDATFTISNLGAYGIDGFTPLIDPPQMAILGIGRERGAITTLSLSFDHAAVDGAQAAQLLVEIDRLAAAPDWLAQAPSPPPGGMQTDGQ